MENGNVMPMLFPIEQDEFWIRIRQIIKEEVSLLQETKTENSLTETQGLTQKPLYKTSELCAIFKVSRTTIHDWVKHGRLKKVKVRSRVYFLSAEVQNLLQQ